MRDVRAERAGIAGGIIHGGVHQENIHGVVVRRVEGNLIYQTIVGEQEVTFDAAVVEDEYLDRVRHSELATVDTMLGRVPIERLTIASSLVPMKAGGDLPEESLTAVSRDTAVRAIDALTIGSRLVIVAGPGMGKTTFLHALASTLTTRRTGEIPVPVSLYRYVSESDGKTLIDFALETRFGEMYKGRELEGFADVFRLWNREGKLLFLLDGLDEVPEEKRRALVDQFAALTRFVLTTRPIGRIDAYQPPGGTLQLLPLDDRDVARFVFQWAALDGVGNAFEPRSVLRNLRHDRRLADLSKVPQLLGLICYLWSSHTVRAFRTRADLFAQTTDVMISKGLDILEVTGEERETLPRTLRRWLRKLALDMLAHPTGARLRISRDAMLDDLEIGRSETDAARLFRLARASGLIVRTIDGVEDFQFVHLVFQEYLAAEALAASSDPIAMAERLQHRAAFEEPLRMACAIWADRGEDDRIRQVMHGLVAPEQSDLFGSNVLLAGQCLGEIEGVGQRLPDVVDDVADRLMEHAARWWLRARFAPVMAELKTDGMRRRLVESLSSDDMHVRWAGAVALGLMGDPATLGAVRERLNIEPNDAVSTALIEAIAGIGSPDAIPDLINVLEWLARQSSPDVFMAAATGAALARLGAVGELKMLVEHIDIEIVGDALIEALRYLPPKAAADLVEALNAAGTTVRYSTADEVEPGPSLEEAERAAASEDPETRHAAISQFGSIGNLDARWALLDLVTDDDEDVAKHAAEELADAWSDGWGLIESIDELAALLASAPDVDAAAIVVSLWEIPSARDATVRAWDKHAGTDPRADTIAGLLDHEDEDVRTAATCILGLFRAHERVSDLGKALLTDPSESVRRHAVWALGRLSDQAGVPFLLDSIKDEFTNLEAVCEALGAIGSTDAVPVLLQLLDHEATTVRRSAARALGTLGDAQAVDRLLHQLDDADHDASLAALRALGAFEVGDPSRLVQLLENDDADTRAAAAAGLRSTRGDEVEAALARAARQDASPDVVFAALASLGQSGRGETAGKSLEALLTSEVDDVRAEVCYGLGRAGFRPAMPALRSLMYSDPSQGVRDTAGQAYATLATEDDIRTLIAELSSADDLETLGVIASYLSDHADSDVASLSRQLAEYGIRLLARRDHRALIVKAANGDTKVRIGQPADAVPQGTDPVAFYVSQLSTGDVDERWDAAEALGTMKAVGSVVALAEALLDADEVVAYEAARAIQGMTRDESLHDSATMALAAATAEARRRGTLTELIRLLIDERSDNVTEVVRDMLGVPEAMCELLEDESGDEDVQAALWTIAQRYNLRFMPDRTVIMPTGERMACAAGRSQLGIA
ncbi:MAG TPA: HEAT repeat domain-containing protein [Candidatus Limnocylindrales bacterium]|nr:HEAT repeat domain-containing protein [Candidatus Limnocylindrales bacterium]